MCMSVGTQLQSVVLCNGRSTGATGFLVYKGEGSACVLRNRLWGGVGCRVGEYRGANGSELPLASIFSAQNHKLTVHMMWEPQSSRRDTGCFFYHIHEFGSFIARKACISWHISWQRPRSGNNERDTAYPGMTHAKNKFLRHTLCTKFHRNSFCRFGEDTKGRAIPLPLYVTILYTYWRQSIKTVAYHHKLFFFYFRTFSEGLNSSLKTSNLSLNGGDQLSALKKDATVLSS